MIPKGSIRDDAQSGLARGCTPTELEFDVWTQVVAS